MLACKLTWRPDQQGEQVEVRIRGNVWIVGFLVSSLHFISSVSSKSNASVEYSLFTCVCYSISDKAMMSNTATLEAGRHSEAHSRPRTFALLPDDFFVQSIPSHGPSIVLSSHHSRASRHTCHTALVLLSMYEFNRRHRRTLISKRFMISSWIGGKPSPRLPDESR